MTAADLVSAIAQATGKDPNSAFHIFAEALIDGEVRKFEIQSVKREAIDGTGAFPDVVVISLVEVP